MTIELIGVATLMIGLIALWRGPEAGLVILVVSCIFGAAAAVKLPALGGASILPSHILIIFFSAVMLARADLRKSACTNLLFPKPGFWLLAFVVYSTLTAVFLPRIFAGMTYVYSLARAGENVGIVVSPLAPFSSNITQSVYLCADVVAFAGVAALASRRGAVIIGQALLYAAVLNIIFGIADLITHRTGTGYILSFIRNANYRMLDDGEILGLKRIVGSYAEAGAYGYASLGFYSFSMYLWLHRIWSRVTGPISLLLLVALLLCTSTTAYIALAIVSLIFWGACGLRLVQGRGSSRDLTYFSAVPLAFLVVSLWIALSPATWMSITDYLDATIFNKLETQSGVERSRWNEYAIRTVMETSWFGAGLGSVRASSIFVALLANVGIVGFALFSLFVASVLWPAGSGGVNRDDEKLGNAACYSCMTLLIAAAVSAGGIDPGLYFFFFAALAVATRSRAAERLAPIKNAMNRSASGYGLSFHPPRQVTVPVRW